MKTNKLKTLHRQRRSWTQLFCIYFCICGRQKPKDPQVEPPSDKAITWGGIGGLWSLVYICGADTSLLSIYVLLSPTPIQFSLIFRSILMIKMSKCSRGTFCFIWDGALRNFKHDPLITPVLLLLVVDSKNWTPHCPKRKFSGSSKPG